MTPRSGRAAPLAALAAVVLCACGEATAPAAPISPAPVAQQPVGPYVIPPPASGAPADTSPAGSALTAAARKTSESGSFRVKLGATFAGAASGPRGSMVGTGESESHTRFHLGLLFNSGTQQLTTESVSYDGVDYGRSNSQPWHVVAGAGSSGDPRSYLGYLSGATGVRDDGPGTLGGQPAERFEALVDIARRAAASPSATASAAAPTRGQLVAWVDGASGRLVDEEVTPNAGTSLETHLSIAFSDFGGDIKVVPPLRSP